MARQAIDDEERPPVRVVHNGTEAEPMPVVFTENANQANQRTTASERRSSADGLANEANEVGRRAQLPRTVDRAAVVEEVVTRRLVVIDDDDRERLVAEEDSYGELTLQITSRHGEASFTVSVGDGDDDNGQPRAMLTVSSGRTTVTLFSDSRSAVVDVEQHGAGGPSLQLHHDGVEVHHVHTRAVFAGADPADQ